LKRRGIKSIRPLEGGFPLWTELGFPVEVAMSNNRLALGGRI
jgi:hypothetical protein